MSAFCYDPRESRGMVQQGKSPREFKIWNDAAVLMLLLLAGEADRWRICGLLTKRWLPELFIIVPSPLSLQWGMKQILQSRT